MYPRPGILQASIEPSGERTADLFLADLTGSEVDLVVDNGLNLVPVEVKLSTTPGRNMAKGIEAFRDDFGKKTAQEYVVHPGDIKLPLGPDAWAWPFADF